MVDQIVTRNDLTLHFCPEEGLMEWDITGNKSLLLESQ